MRSSELLSGATPNPPTAAIASPLSVSSSSAVKTTEAVYGGSVDSAQSLHAVTAPRYSVERKPVGAAVSSDANTTQSGNAVRNRCRVSAKKVVSSAAAAAAVVRSPAAGGARSADAQMFPPPVHLHTSNSGGGNAVVDVPAAPGGDICGAGRPASGSVGAAVAADLDGHIVGPGTNPGASSGGVMHDMVCDRSAGETAACHGDDGGEGTSSGLTALERGLLLRSSGSVVLKQAPAGVSRSELSEFFRKFGPLQPPGDGVSFPCQRRQQVVVRFQRLQDAAKCLRALQQQQQRQHPVRGETYGGSDSVTGVPGGGAGREGKKADAYSEESGSSQWRMQNQSTGLEDLLQQDYPRSLGVRTNDALIRQQGLSREETMSNVADGYGYKNGSGNNLLLGCASAQLSRADKIKISALRGHQRAVQLLRTEGILEDMQPQPQQRIVRHSSEDLGRSQADAPTSVKKQQEQYTSKVPSTQVLTSYKEEKPGQPRSALKTPAVTASTTTTVAELQDYEGDINKAPKSSSTVKRPAPHTTMMVTRKRASAEAAKAAEKEGRGVSPSRSHSIEKHVEEGEKRRATQQQMNQRGEATAGSGGAGAVAAGAVPSAAAPVSATTRQQQQQQQSRQSGSAARVTGGVGSTKSVVAPAAVNARGGGLMRQSNSSSSDSLLQLLSGAAVAEHVEKQEAAAGTWGTVTATGTTSASSVVGQSSKQPQSGPQLPAWGEPYVLDPVHDAERIRYLR